MAERLIRCARLLTPDGWRQDVTLVTDADGMIQDLMMGGPARVDLELAGVVIPGMPNLHSHAFQRAIAGLTGRPSGGAGGDHFWSWREAMYRVALQVTPDQLHAIASWLYADMLRAGYTSCAEFHYLHNAPDGRPYDDAAEMSHQLIGAAQAVGLPLTLLPVWYRWSGMNCAPPADEQRRFVLGVDAYRSLVESLQDMARDRADVHIGIAPHSLRALDVDSLGEALQAATPSMPVHMHVSEQPAEVEACQQALGARPVEWLLANVDLGPRWCLVHATHTTADERVAAARTGAVAGLCPSTEGDLGDGFFEPVHWFESDGALGIGSDSNLVLSPTEELRWLEFGARLRSGRRLVIGDGHTANGRLLWQWAAEGGGQALGQPLGEVAVGHRADLLEIDDGHPLTVGRDADAVVDTWVFSGEHALLRRVLVGGRVRVEQGHLPQAASLETAARRAMSALMT